MIVSLLHPTINNYINFVVSLARTTFTKWHNFGYLILPPFRNVRLFNIVHIHTDVNESRHIYEYEQC